MQLTFVTVTPESMLQTKWRHGSRVTFWYVVEGIQATSEVQSDEVIQAKQAIKIPSQLPQPTVHANAA